MYVEQNNLKKDIIQHVTPLSLKYLEIYRDSFPHNKPITGTMPKHTSARFEMSRPDGCPLME